MRKPGLNSADFVQQFPHHDKYPEDTEGTVTPWWKQPKAPAYARGGHVIEEATAIARRAARKGK